MRDNEIEGGHYYNNCREANGKMNQSIKSIEFDQALWELSEVIISEKGFVLKL